jgi:hypothetical protein
VNEGTYEDHAQRLGERARKEYLEWLNSMSPADRRRVAEMGLDTLPCDDYEVSGHSPWQPDDAAESPACRTEIDIAAELDTAPEELADTLGIDPVRALRVIQWADSIMHRALCRHEAHLLQLVVGGLLQAKNPKLHCAGLAFATDLAALNGLGSQREYARRNNISRSAVSKVNRFWKRTLGLKQSPHQKTEAACETYSRVQKQKHWRRRKTTASELAKRLKKGGRRA